MTADSRGPSYTRPGPSGRVHLVAGWNNMRTECGRVLKRGWERLDAPPADRRNVCSNCYTTYEAGQRRRTGLGQPSLPLPGTPSGAIAYVCPPTGDRFHIVSGTAEGRTCCKRRIERGWRPMAEPPDNPILVCGLCSHWRAVEQARS